MTRPALLLLAFLLGLVLAWQAPRLWTQPCDLPCQIDRTIQEVPWGR